MSRNEPAILQQWQRVSRLPFGSWLFSRLIGLTVPYAATINARVLNLMPGRAQAQMADRRAVRNHLRSIHAVALTNLAELTANHRLQGFVFVGHRSEHLNFRAGNIDRYEEGKPHDVIPVGVGKIDFGADRSLGQVMGQHVIGQITDPGAGIDDDMAVDLGKTQLNTGGIAAVFHGFRPWTGNGAPYPPKFDLDHGSLSLPCIVVDHGRTRPSAPGRPTL